MNRAPVSEGGSAVAGPETGRRILARLVSSSAFFLLFAACSPKVDVTIRTPYDYDWNGWDVYDAESIWVTCSPYRNVTYLDLMIDSVVVGTDTFPGPASGFEWDVSQLTEGVKHPLQARAISGSHEYRSPVVYATVGYRTRLLVDGTEKTFSVYRPDAKLVASFEPVPGAYPQYPRFRPGCRSVVFVADRRLYEADYGPGQLLDSVENGIFSCDASPVSQQVVFHGYPADVAHLFLKDGAGPRVQLTHDSDYVIIDSSRFTCIENSCPVFSPDGTRLAYYRKSKCLVPGDPHENETREDAFVINSNGTNPVNLTAGVGDGRFSGFTWTFDGKWVLFRAGAGPIPEAVLAANMSGHAITGLALPSVAMACSPKDSVVAYIGLESARLLYTMKLCWTDDTIYTGGAGVKLGGYHNGQRSYIDWGIYSRQ
jgi:hypothetical protein